MDDVAVLVRLLRMRYDPEERHARRGGHVDKDVFRDWLKAHPDAVGAAALRAAGSRGRRVCEGEGEDGEYRKMLAFVRLAMLDPNERPFEALQREAFSDDALEDYFTSEDDFSYDENEVRAVVDLVAASSETEEPLEELASDTLVEGVCSNMEEGEPAGTSAQFMMLLGQKKGASTEQYALDSPFQTDELTGWPLHHPVRVFPSNTIVNFELLWQLFSLTGGADPSSGQRLSGWEFVKDERSGPKATKALDVRSTLSPAAAKVLLQGVRNVFGGSAGARSSASPLQQWMLANGDKAEKAMLKNDHAGRALRLAAMRSQVNQWTIDVCAPKDLERFRQLSKNRDAGIDDANPICALNATAVTCEEYGARKGSVRIDPSSKQCTVDSSKVKVRELAGRTCCMPSTIASPPGADVALTTAAAPGAQQEDAAAQKELASEFSKLDAGAAAGFKVWISVYKDLFAERMYNQLGALWELIRGVLPSIYAMFASKYESIEKMAKEKSIRGWLAYFVKFFLDAGASVASMATWLFKAVASLPKRVASGIKSLYEKSKENGLMVALVYAATQVMAYARWIIDMYARNPKQTIKFLKVMQMVRDQLCRFAGDQYFTLFSGAEAVETTWAEAASDVAGNLGETVAATATVGMREAVQSGGKLDKIWSQFTDKGIQMLSDEVRKLPFGSFFATITEVVAETAAETLRESTEIMLMANEAKQVSGMALDLLSPAKCYTVARKKWVRQREVLQDAVNKVEAQQVGNNDENEGRTLF